MNISQHPTSPTAFIVSVTLDDFVAAGNDTIDEFIDLLDDDDHVDYVIEPYTDPDGRLLFTVAFDTVSYDIFDAADLIAQFGQPVYDRLTAC
jgi:hypothetical protein